MEEFEEYIEKIDGFLAKKELETHEKYLITKALSKDYWAEWSGLNDDEPENDDDEFEDDFESTDDDDDDDNDNNDESEEESENDEDDEQQQPKDKHEKPEKERIDFAPEPPEEILQNKEAKHKIEPIEELDEAAISNVMKPPKKLPAREPPNKGKPTSKPTS